MSKRRHADIHALLRRKLSQCCCLYPWVQQPTPSSSDALIHQNQFFEPLLRFGRHSNLPRPLSPRHTGIFGLSGPSRPPTPSRSNWCRWYPDAHVPLFLVRPFRPGRLLAPLRPFALRFSCAFHTSKPLTTPNPGHQPSATATFHVVFLLYKCTLLSLTHYFLLLPIDLYCLLCVHSILPVISLPLANWPLLAPLYLLPFVLHITMHSFQT